MNECLRLSTFTFWILPNLCKYMEDHHLSSATKLTKNKTLVGLLWLRRATCMHYSRIECLGWRYGFFPFHYDASIFLFLLLFNSYNFQKYNNSTRVYEWIIHEINNLFACEMNKSCKLNIIYFMDYSWEK